VRQIKRTKPASAAAGRKPNTPADAPASAVNGCEVCADPVTVSLRETAIKRWTASIAVFRCPQCGCLILDDVYGWKGSGVVFRATPEMIDD
jgi:hypothetical protein